MAHFALLNENNIVVRVEVVSNNVCQNESEGLNFLCSLYGESYRFKQTSYNGNIRKNYAGIGYIYDEQRDAFIPPKPYESWVLNEQTCLWNPPVPYPNDNKDYIWDENTKTWLQV